MPERELTPLEALSYLDDIAHGRKMEYDPHVLKRIVEKELKRLEELEEVLDFIKSNIAYTRALCDRTKNPDNDLICFDIRGLVNEETWRKIYEAIGTPII